MDPVPADPEAKPDAVKDAPVADAVTDDAKETKPAKEIPKPENPRLPKPDRSAMDRKIQDLQEAADVKQARIEELKKLIGNRRDAQKNIMSGSSGTRTRIGELNAAFQSLMVRHRARSLGRGLPDLFFPRAGTVCSFFSRGPDLRDFPRLHTPAPTTIRPDICAALTTTRMIRRDRQDERNAIRKELQAFDATRERMREQVVTMKSKLRFTTVEAVDARSRGSRRPTRTPPCPSTTRRSSSRRSRTSTRAETPSGVRRGAGQGVRRRRRSQVHHRAAPR